jgi:hypothetical protein
MNHKSKHHSIYSVFYSPRNHGKEKQNCIGILKGTKSILKNFSSFNDYLKKYKSITQKITFKTPDYEHFPLLNSQSLSLIPISKSNTDINYPKNSRTTRNIKKYKFALSSDDLDNDKNYNNKFKLAFRNKIRIQLNTLESKMEKYLNKKKECLETHNPIISDFFYKWTQEYSFDCKNPKGNHFSSLCYDEKKNIFCKL